MDWKEKAAELVAQMTLEEKAGLCSGRDDWHLKSVERLGVPEIMVTDGPHGLRKKRESGGGLSEENTVPATCFPTAAATACSFDPELLRTIGAAIGDECRQEDVAVLLGPGVNMKRSPLCGRNFEYFSEDPCLAGELGAALIEGVQSRGVGTSLKHFATNNQETRRLCGESVVDERALREIYLPAFERAVKQGKPWTVMCAYNKLQGRFCSENERLLTKILRDEWGYEGLVVSDWGATADRVEGVAAGLDLEMPASGGYNDSQIVEAVRSGRLPEEKLDLCARRVVELILKSQARTPCIYDVQAHHELARRAAAESAVLLKNEGLLPLKKGAKVAVIGGFAETPRYQGSGSSRIHPTKVDSALEALKQAGFAVEYAEGYRGGEPDPALLDEAAALAARCEVAVVFAGLPDEYESEGFDRRDMAMPASHNALISRVAAANPNTAVVLLCGSPVELPWMDEVRALLLMYLGGQAVGGAAADLLTGAKNPCGKLAESWAARLEDIPSSRWFPGTGRTVEYRESLFIGYRYFDTARVAPRFPFGYGLSYTSFTYSTPRVTRNYGVSCVVKNTGTVAGAEIVQLYVAPKANVPFRAAQELKGFKKLWLEPGESAVASFQLSERDFAYYNTEAARWCVEGGAYELRLAASSRDVRLTLTVDVPRSGPHAPTYEGLDCYSELAARGTLDVDDAAFAALLGRPIPPSSRGDAPIDRNTSLAELLETEQGRALFAELQKDRPDFLSDPMMSAMLMDMPLRFFASFGNPALTHENLQEVIDRLNAAL